MANVTTPKQPEVDPVGGDILRSAFVEMLFALAVSQVAIHAADLVGVNKPWQDKMPALAHLGVGLVLIAASWLGWSQSASPGMKDKIKYVFSLPFVGLLLDVLLVILYFIIVRTVEIEQKGGEIDLAPASAKPESFWLCVVFGVYASWDLLADVFSPGCIPKAPLLPRIWKVLRAAFVSVFCSIVCLLLSYVAFVVATRRTEAHEVLYLDGMLISLILLFRVLKAFENVLAPRLAVTDCKVFEQPRNTYGNELLWGIVLFILYGVCFLGTFDFQPRELPRSLLG